MDEIALSNLSEEIDQQLLYWTINNKLTPDMMMAIVLARITLVAKETNFEGALVALLDKAKHKVMEDSMESKEKGVLH